MGNIKSINSLEEQVIDLYTKGYSKKQIAIALELPLYEVQKIFKKDNIKQLVNEILETRELLLKEKQLKILEEVTDQMIEKADGDMTKLLGKNRDILDVIQTTQSLTKEMEKKRLGTNESNIMINVLQQLIEDKD